MSYILSIVIPTRNRQFYLEHAVKQIYNSTNEEVQIVVQDNSDDNALKEKMAQYTERVKYNYIAKRLSSMGNYNMGISLAEGEYVCCIGDDDGVMPQILDIVKWAKKNGIKSVNQVFFSQYWWPEANKCTAEFNDGVLICAVPSCKISIVDPKKEMLKLLKDPRLLFTAVQMAKLYYGIMKKELLDEVKIRTGVYCGGLSADIYPATAATLLLNEIYIIDFPFTLSGVCSKSTACSSLNGKHVGLYETAPQLVGSEDYPWSTDVVRFYSVETIWSESMLHAIRDMGHDEYIKKYSKARQTACTMWRHSEYKEHIMETYLRENGSVFRLGLAFLQLGVQSLCSRAAKVLKRKKESQKIYKHGVETIIAAQQVLCDSFTEFGVDRLLFETLSLDCQHRNRVL